MAQPVNVRKLRRSLLAYATAGVFIVAMVTAALTYLPFSQRLREAAADSILDTARTSAYAIRELVAGRHKVVQQIASRTGARRLLESYNAGRLGFADYRQQMEPILQDVLNSSDDLTGITRIAQDGSSVAVGESIPTALWPVDHDRGTTIVARGPQDTPHGLRVVVASPVMNRDKVRIGTDIIGLTMQPVAQRVAAGKQKAGGSTRVYMMFRRGGDAFLLLADGSVQRLDSVPHLPAARVAAASTGPDRTDSITTAELIIAIAAIDRNEWSMVVTRDRDEVFAGLNYQLWLIGVAVLGLAVVGTGGVYLLLRPVTGTLIIHADSMANEVARATSDLNATMLQLAAAKAQSEQARDKAETALTDLRRTQDSLIEAEKMASLGGLVAGVAHEINTPVGIVLTSASYLAKETESLKRLYETQELTTDDMDAYISAAAEASQLIQSNAARAADLIHSFKQVAVDRTAGEMRSIDIKDYIHEVLTSLGPQLKKCPVTVDVAAPDDLRLRTYPGALSQILTNLIQNSLIHGFDAGAAGTIRISVADQGDTLELVYSDDGKGIPPQHAKKVFDPFFTTRRDAGGSGLGLNILYNTVSRTLKGSVRLDETVESGVRFVIRFPKEAEAPVD